MQDSLKKKTIKSVKWSGVNTLFNAIVTPLFYAVLALLLSPNEYAYISVITLFYRILPLIGKFGLEEAYIQYNQSDKNVASSVFLLNFLIGLLLIITLFIFSPLIEKFYGLLSLKEYLRILSIGIFFESIVSIFKASLKKYFFFKEWAIVLMSTMSLRIGVTVLFVYLGLGAKSFVYGIIFSTLYFFILFVFISFKKVNVKVKFFFKILTVKNMMNFGYPITGKRFLENFSQRADEVIIGVFLSSEILGIYFFGKNLIMQIKTAVVKSFSMVLLPLYSQLKNSEASLKSTFLEIVKYSFLIGFPMLVGVSITANLFVPLIFGEKWTDSILIIQVLSIVIIFPTITGNNATSLLYSLNRPLLVFLIELITSTIYLIILFVITYLYPDIKVVLIVFCLFLVLDSIVLQNFVNQTIGLTWKLLIKKIKHSTYSIVMMVIVIEITKFFIGKRFSDLTELILVIITGIIIYFICEMKLNRKALIKMYGYLARK